MSHGTTVCDACSLPNVAVVMVRGRLVAPCICGKVNRNPKLYDNKGQLTLDQFLMSQKQKDHLLNYHAQTKV